MIAAERRVARLASYRGRYYWGGTAVWVLYFVFPLLPGWLTRWVFDTFQSRGASPAFWLGLVGLAAAEAVAVVAIWWGHILYNKGMHAAVSLVRANAVHAQLASGGEDAAPRTLSTGDALARLRDDPIDVLFLADNWVDLAGSVIYGTGAAFLLARIDPWAALVGIAPLFAIGAANSTVGNVVRRIRAKARVATSEVSGFLNATFQSTLTVKLSGAQADVVDRLDTLNRRRATTMVADQVWNDGLYAVNNCLTDTCVGLALVVAARSRLSAGEVSLFATYLFNLVWLPQRLGGVVVGRRRYDVSAGRLDELVSPPPPPPDEADTAQIKREHDSKHESEDESEDESESGSQGERPRASQGRRARHARRRRKHARTRRRARAARPPAAMPGGVDRLVVHRPLPILVAAPLPRPASRERQRLARLEVRGLQISARDVGPVDFALGAGSLTVVAGPVGSGKSSLLRGLLGLVETDAGDVLWNGRLIGDRASFFVPPQAGYVPQVPRLFAESLADNVRLGYPIDDAALADALHLAVLDDDVAGFSDGVDTLIGSRGVRLSGGQAQRAAAARAFVHRPELLVLDDLASALDAETEIALWDRLAAAGLTVLTASNRAVTLAKADQIIRLGDTTDPR